MANTPVGETLTITVKVDEKDASAKLDSLIKKIEQINEVSKGQGFSHLKEVSKTLTEFANASSGLNNAAKSIENISKATSGLVRNLQNVGTKQLGDATKKLSKMGDAFSKFDGKSVNMNFTNASGGSGQSSAGNMQLMSSLAKSLASDFKRAASAGMQLAKLPFKMLLSPMQGVVSKAAGMANSIGRLFHTIGRVAFMRAIRAGIKMVTAALREGVSAVYDWASVVGNSFVGTMDMMTTSFNYLRNSIGAMISPLLDALAPALDFIIDKIVSVINIFNQLIATLTGASTWRRAEKVATSYGDAASDAAKNTKKANNAAKELRNTLLGFDEINRLDAPDKSGSSASPGSGSGSSSSGAGALAFTEQPISQQVLDFAKMLKDAWAKADFTEIGEMIGTKLGNVMMSVPWDSKIKPAVEKIAKSFGTLLNGMFDYRGKGGKAMWDGIAYTAYNALNTAMLGYVTFFNTVHWGGIGAGVGAALKRALYGIDWKLLPEALSAFPNAVIKAINGFNSEFKVKDFADIGQKIGNSIAQAIMNINWQMLFTDVFGIASRVVAGLNGALKGFNANWGSIKQAILDGIKNVPKKTWYGLGTSIGELIFNTATFIGNVVDTLVKAIESGKWGDLVDGIIDGLKKHVDWKTAPKKIGDWISDHLNIITLALGFTFGKFAIEMGIKALTQKLLLAPLIGGGSLATWAQNLAITAGLMIAIGDLKAEVDKGGINSNSFKDKLGRGIAGAIAGFVFTGGNLAGAALGFTVGVKLDMLINALKTTVLDKIPLYKWIEDFMSDATNTTTSKSVFTGSTKHKNANPEPEVPVVTNSTTASASVGKVEIKEIPPIKIPAIAQVTEAQDKLNKNQKSLDGFNAYMQNVTDKVDATKKITKGFTALYDEMKGKGVTGTTILNFVADFARMVGAGVTGTTITNFIANYARMLGTGVTGTTISNFVAEYVRKAGAGIIGEWISGFGATYTQKGGNGLSPSWISGFGATFTSRTISWSQAAWIISGFVANITGLLLNLGSNSKAGGGVYKNGQWLPITQFAAGGTPIDGQMFIAREAGPELVGTIGGNTAVANNDQIVASVSAGVYQAVVQAMGSGNGGVNDITVKIDSETIYRAVKKGERMANGRYGTVVTVG